MNQLQGQDSAYTSKSPLHSHHLHAPSLGNMAFATRVAAGGAATAAAALQSNRSMASDDVVLYVGALRRAYHVNSESLIRSSAYFRNLLNVPPNPASLAGGQSAHRPPIVIDCEEGIFESLLLLMRYGTLEALPPMSSAEIFRLKKEADIYGIHYTEPCPRSRSETFRSDDGSSDLSACSSPSYRTQNGSPKSMMNISPQSDRGTSKRTAHRHCYEGIQLTCTTPRQLADLPEFPVDLADPARLVLVSCLDQEKASIYACDYCTTTGSKHSGRIATQWAINFHHRHAFCTACGRLPNLSPKHFAEMFVAAAAKYCAQANPAQSAPKDPNSAWWVSSDSTCTLRFIRSAGDGREACGCSAGGAGAAREAQPTVWAASCYYSHAFCTCCGDVAAGPVLLSLILAVRYGGSTFNKVSRTSPRSSFTMDSQHTTSPRWRPTTSP